MPDSDILHVHYEVEDVDDGGGEEEQEQEEEEEEEETDDSEETVEGHAEEEVDYVPEVLQSPRASQTGTPGSAQARVSFWVEEEVDKRRRTEGGEASSSQNEWNRSENDDMICSICMDAWTNYGEHHICCLPCGHLYGMSCINRWLQQRKNAGKCPQCNRKCSTKDVRKIFAPRIVAADGESQKRIKSLEATCASLEKKEANWCKKEVEWKKRETDMQSKLRELSEVTSFILKKELLVDGARLIDVDASNQIVLVARRGFGGTHVLTKISLMSPYEREDIGIPFCTNAVRDLHISPAARNLVLFSSLGKKLAILSMESNHIILDYDLPDAAWSCSWDQNSSHHVYAGLKNGLLVMFDMRQTVGPLKILQGLTNNPIHTIHSLSSHSTVSNDKSVLSASAYGICQWNFDALEEGPFLIPETNQGVCTSLAYCSSRDELVASYRPKVGMSNEIVYSQPSPSPSHTAGHRVDGCHVAFKKEDHHQFSKLGSAHANIDAIRLPKSTIIDLPDCNSLFVSADAIMGDLILQELPSFRSVQHLKVHKHPVRDVKYSYGFDGGLLGCLSDDILQLFCTKGS